MLSEAFQRRVREGGLYYLRSLHPVTKIANLQHYQVQNPNQLPFLSMPPSDSQEIWKVDQSFPERFGMLVSHLDLPILEELTSDRSASSLLYIFVRETSRRTNWQPGPGLDLYNFVFREGHVSQGIPVLLALAFSVSQLLALAL